MSSRDVDMRTDIWALGVICFELLTGSCRFQADTLPQLCMAISVAPPARLRSIRPELPAEVEAIILRCLNKDPSQRYATVAEFAAALVAVRSPARTALCRAHRAPGCSGRFLDGHEPAPAFVARSGAHWARGSNRDNRRIRPHQSNRVTEEAAAGRGRRSRAGRCSRGSLRRGSLSGRCAGCSVSTAGNRTSPPVSPTSAQLAPPATNAPDLLAPPQAPFVEAPPAAEARVVSPSPGSAQLSPRSRTGASKVGQGSSPTPTTAAQRNTRSERSKAAEPSKPTEPMNVVPTAPPPAASPSVTVSAAHPCAPESAVKFRIQRRGLWCLLAPWLVGGLFWPLPLVRKATATSRALAVQLFDQAEALVGKGRFAEACPKYAESFRLDPQLGALIYLAECYEKNGQLASAWGSYREAEEMAQKRHDERARARARTRHRAPTAPRLPDHPRARISPRARARGPARRRAAVRNHVGWPGGD